MKRRRSSVAILFLHIEKALDLATRKQKKKKIRCFIPCVQNCYSCLLSSSFLTNIKNDDENNHNLCIIYMSHRDIWIKYNGARIFGFFENKMSFQTFQRHTNRFTKLLYNNTHETRQQFVIGEMSFWFNSCISFLSKLNK